jgi:hypothetical protein
MLLACVHPACYPTHLSPFLVILTACPYPSDILLALKLGKSLRSANITYSVALRVLEQVGFPLDHYTYYNIRDRTASAELNEFAALIVALKEAGFIFKCRIKEEINTETGVIIDRQL